MSNPRTTVTRRLRPSLLMLVLLALAVSGAVLSAAPQASKKIHLPVVLESYAGSVASGIYGTVNDLNKGAPGVALDLLRYDGDDTTLTDSTTTNNSGAYLFSSVPTLPPGHTYYVRYGPNGDVDTRLWLWFGPDIDNYTAGTAVSGSDFDIGDIVLRKPDPGATVSLPFTFRWDRRMVPGDDYVIELFDPDGTDNWFTNNLGDVGQFTTTNLPSEIVPGKVYSWTMWVYHGEDSWGIAYWYNDIIFSSTAQADAAGAQIWQRGGPDVLPLDGRPQRR